MSSIWQKQWKNRFRSRNRDWIDETIVLRQRKSVIFEEGRKWRRLWVISSVSCIKDGRLRCEWWRRLRHTHTRRGWDFVDMACIMHEWVVCSPFAVSLLYIVSEVWKRSNLLLGGATYHPLCYNVKSTDFTYFSHQMLELEHLGLVKMFQSSISFYLLIQFH